LAPSSHTTSETPAALLPVLVALVAFCLLALFSVGLFYLPAAVALVIAVVGWRPPPSAPPNG
jgi:hypothetical protein